MRRIFVPRRRPAKRRIVIIGLIAVAIASLVAARRAIAPPRPLAVRAISGGTLSVAGLPVRLFGVDAPEAAQTCRGPDGIAYACGKKAADFMRQVVAGKVLSCHARGRDGYRGTVAVCYADGGDVGRALVRAGWAVHAHGTFEYLRDENRARAARRGMWAGPFERPAEWRQQHAASASANES